MPMLTPYPMFDADMHFAGEGDAYLRYIDPKFRDRTIRVVRDKDGNRVQMAEDRVLQTYRPDEYSGKRTPGNLGEWLKASQEARERGDAIVKEDDSQQSAEGEAVAEGRDDRIAQLDEQGVEACIIYGAILTEGWLHDPDTIYASLWAWNRWCVEEWSYAYKDRIIIPAPISLLDVDKAVELLDYALEHGARSIFLRPGPFAGRSPSDPHFDPFWARVNEAGLVTTFHITFAGPEYHDMRSKEWGQQLFESFYTQSAWQWTFCYGEQSIMETIAALIYDNLFGRVPNIKVITSELGCEWGPPLTIRMDKMRGMARNGPWIGGQLKERPSAIFKRHVRMQAYPQDDVVGVVERLGPEVVLAGSDFPHAEGLAEPTEFGEKVKELPLEQQRLILRDNGLQMFGLA